MLSQGLGTAVLLVLVVWTVDGLFLQTQMALLGSTPLPNLVIKVVLAFAILVVGFGRAISGRTTPVPRPIFLLWMAFAIYLMLETLLLVARFGYPADYVIFNYFAYYFPILLLPVMFYLRGILDESRIVHTLILFFIPLGLFGIAQNLSGSNLLPTESPNGYLQVMSSDFFGSVRAFSFFQSPSYFGHFTALVAGLGMALWIERTPRRKPALVLILLALLSGLSTMTRATQIEIACAMFTAWMLYRRPHHRRLAAVLPIIYGFVGLIVAFVGPLLFGGLSGDNILSNWSIFGRYVAWEHYGRIWLGNGLPNFLFGAGIAQNDRFRLGQDVLIDNSFLGVGVHIGVIGIAFWLAITWYLWNYMLQRSKERISPVRAGAAGAWSVWLFTSVFNISLFYPLAFLVFMFTDAEPEARARRRTSPRRHTFARVASPLPDSI